MNEWTFALGIIAAFIAGALVYKFFRDNAREDSNHNDTTSEGFNDP